MMKYYLRALYKYDVFCGRASKEEFNQFVLYNTVFVLTAIAIDNILGTTATGLPYGVFNMIYVTAITLPSLALAARRVHDVGKSGWFSVFLLISVVGIGWLLILLFSEGTEGVNKYGLDPKEMAIT
jgi:uncharacterized membrane protein YhaH (DUF805 family)